MIEDLSIDMMQEDDVRPLAVFSLGHVDDDDDYFSYSLDEQKTGRRSVLIARVGGKTAGYVHYNRYPQYQPFRSLRIPEIQDLYVDLTYRRMGIGRALIEACEALAVAEKASEIGIGVGVAHDFGTAQRLYAGLGYVPDGAGVVFDRTPISVGEVRPVDNRLCLMMVKSL